MSHQATRLIEAHKAGDEERAAEIVANMSDASLVADLSATPNPMDFVRAVFSSLDATNQRGELRRVLFVKEGSALIDTGRAFSARQAKECIAFFASELDKLPLRAVADITMAILASHRESVREAEAKSHELLPKCLALLACADSVVYRDDAGRTSTTHYADFQDLVLRKLCEPRWPRAALLPMMNTLREMPLTDAQLRVVVKKAMAGAPSLELQALPSLVYQLLLLAGRGCKFEVLAGLAAHFEALEHRTRGAHSGRANEAEDDDDADSIDGADRDEPAPLGSQEIRRAEDAAADPELLAAVQSTVVSNIDLALRQDHGLGSTLLRMMKTRALQLSSFSLSLLLLLARQARFEDEAIAWLTGAVRNAFNESAWSFGSPWLEHVLRPLRSCRVAPLLARITRPTGPEHLLPSAVLLATAWMDASAGFGASSLATTAEAAGDALDAGATAAALALPVADEDERAQGLSANSRLARLGASSLVEVFRGHSGSHAEILDLVLARIAARAPSCMRWVQLLSRLARTVPTLLMQHVARLRECLGYAVHLPPAVGNELLRAILPLSTHRPELRDSLVLVLRKAAFQRDEGARLVAVRGFLLLLDGGERRGGAGLSCAEPSAAGASALDSEVLSFLKRCLTHQPAVLLALYTGLPLVCARRAQLLEPVLELLLAQLSRYCTASRTEPAPLDLHACIGQSSGAAEAEAMGTAGTAAAAAAASAPELVPLALLVRSLASCLALEPARARDEAPSLARALLNDLRARMRAASPADFGLDKGTDFSPASALGQVNVSCARLLQAVLLVLLEVEVSCEGDQSIGRAIALLDKHHAVTLLLKGGPAAGGKGAAGKGAAGKGAAGKGKAAAVKPVAPSTFTLALAPSIRILELASASAAAAASAPDCEAAAPDELHSPLGEPLLRCAVLSAQHALEALEGSARTQAACVLAPLLLAEAEHAVSTAVSEAEAVATAGAKGAASGKEKGAASSKDKEGGKESVGRPYGALVFDALETIVKGASADLQSLAHVLRFALADGRGAEVGALAGSMASLRGARAIGDGQRPDAHVGTSRAASAAAVVSETLRMRLEPMLSQLLRASGAVAAKETEACVRVVRALGLRLSAELAGGHAEWALALCSDVPGEGCHVATARALIAHWLHLSSRANQNSLKAELGVLLEARSHVGSKLGDGEEEDEEDFAQTPLCGLKLMHEGNAMQLAQPALDRVEAIIGEVEHALLVLKRVMPAKATGASGKGGAADEAVEDLDEGASESEQSTAGQQNHALLLQQQLLQRILELEPVLLALSSCQLTPVVAEHALRCLAKFYRALGTAFGLAPKIGRLHEQIVEMHWQRLSCNVYRLLTFISAGGVEVDRKRTKREARLVPSLIFRVEQFEGLLVRISKKLKINLTSQMRRSTARDFRITLGKIEEAEKENEEHPKKKARKPKAKAVSEAEEDEDEGDSSPEDVDDK